MIEMIEEKESIVVLVFALIVGCAVVVAVGRKLNGGRLRQHLVDAYEAELSQ